MHYLGIWHVFVWELGKILFGKLARFRLGGWRIFIWEVGETPKEI